MLEISSFYTCLPETTIIWGTVAEIRSETKFLSLWAIFCPLIPAPLQQPRKPKFWKNEKSIWRCHHFKLVQQKPQLNDVFLLKYGVWQTFFSHFRPFFALLHHYWPQKLIFGKNVKNTWIYYSFTHVHYKSRSYDVWFLRYKVQ